MIQVLAAPRGCAAKIEACHRGENPSSGNPGADQGEGAWLTRERVDSFRSGREGKNIV